MDPSLGLMTINTSADYPLYLAYRNSGPSADLIIPAAAMCVPAALGVLMNSFVIFVTIKTSNLRAGTANYLMALICLFEVMHQSGHFIFLTIVASGVNFVPMFKADLFAIPMLFSVNSCMMAMFCASVDRLFAIIAPFKHKKVSMEYKVHYLFVHTMICAGFGLYALYYMLSYGVTNSGKPTTGCLCELLSDDAVRDRFFIDTTMLNLACIFCYLLIWAVIKRKNGVTKETNTRLLRSLVVILGVSVGGYLINLSIYQLAFTFRAQLGDFVRIWQFTFIAAVLLNICAASNAAILYLNSTEYRKAFKKELAELRKLCRIKGPTTSTSSVQILNSQQQKPTTQSIAIPRF